MFLFHKLQHTRFSLSFSSFCAHHHLSASLSLQPSCVRVQRHRAPHTRPFPQGRSLPGLLLLALCRRARVHAVRLASGWLQQTIAKLQQQFAMEAGGGAMKRQTATGEHSFVGRAGGGAARGRNADMCVKQQDGPRSCCAVRQRFRATARWLGWHARIRGHTLCFAHAANAALSQQLAGGGGANRLAGRLPPPRARWVLHRPLCCFALQAPRRRAAATLYGRLSQRLDCALERGAPFARRPTAAHTHLPHSLISRRP